MISVTSSCKVATDNFAAANISPVGIKARKHKDILDRMQRIKNYVAKRLREELGPNPPHGKQAELAREMGITGPALSNVVSSKSRGAGEYIQRAAAKHWGLTYAQLEAVAVGEAVPTPVRKDRSPPIEEAILAAKRLVDHPGVILDRAIVVHRQRFGSPDYAYMTPDDHFKELHAEYERQIRMEARKGLGTQGGEEAEPDEPAMEAAPMPAPRRKTGSEA